MVWTDTAVPPSVITPSHNLSVQGHTSRAASVGRPLLSALGTGEGRRHFGTRGQGVGGGVSSASVRGAGTHSVGWWDTGSAPSMPGTGCCCLGPVPPIPCPGFPSPGREGRRLLGASMGRHVPGKSSAVEEGFEQSLGFRLPRCRVVQFGRVSTAPALRQPCLWPPGPRARRDRAGCRGCVRTPVIKAEITHVTCSCPECSPLAQVTRARIENVPLREDYMGVLHDAKLGCVLYGPQRRFLGRGASMERHLEGSKRRILPEFSIPSHLSRSRSHTSQHHYF